MVVVSGGWGKNVATYPTPTANDDTVKPNEMCAKAVLICRPNSHPFQDRILCLDQAVKVGRSVARAKAAVNNAIFDCKVLSRHHALLWYDCGKFFLQDTKSSNGTFVNNNRLSSNESEAHEISSGDIVQFGVDVLENNRKVTHGCIIATLKLYLPDGKEAKASPSITEANRQGLVPLDELYKLNQIIQEATRREQCLESKLTALQHFTEEVKKTIDYTWQVKVDEEKLLSRVAALESQLLQARKNWSDDKIREELTKLQEDKMSYQVAAKDALQKLHAEKLDALAVATEQERARLTAEQEAQLTKELLSQAQLQLQEVAQKLVDEQKRADEEKLQLEQKEQELKAQLETETQAFNDLKEKLQQHVFPGRNMNLFEEYRERLKIGDIYIDDNLKVKDEFFEENEQADSILTMTLPAQNHINLTVCKEEPEEVDDVQSVANETVIKNESGDVRSVEGEKSAEVVEEIVKEIVQVSSKTPYDEREDDSKESTPLQNGSQKPEEGQEKSDSDEKHQPVNHIDSKTLKYQYQSAQIELKKQIEKLESVSKANQSRIGELEMELLEQKSCNAEQSKLSEKLREELRTLQEKQKESCSECQHLREKVQSLTGELNCAQQSANKAESLLNEYVQTELETKTKQPSPLNFEEVAALEEELVLIKERYAVIAEEKTMLNKKLNTLREQYNTVCNNSYNKIFFYVAPLVLMVLYLLISAMAS